MTIYFIQNTLVHMVDFIVFQMYYDHKNDEQLFMRMFSYKLYQAVIIGMLSLIFSQTLCPSIGVITKHPRLLLDIFKLTIPANILMLFTFLYELTFYDQHQRSSIFET